MVKSAFSLKLKEVYVLNWRMVVCIEFSTERSPVMLLRIWITSTDEYV